MASYASIASSAPIQKAAELVATAGQASQGSQASPVSTVVSPSYLRSSVPVLQTELQELLKLLHQVTTAPDVLLKAIDNLRADMEIPQGGIRPGGGRFGPAPQASRPDTSKPSRVEGSGSRSTWRTSTYATSTVNNPPKPSAFDTRGHDYQKTHASAPSSSPRPNPGRYQSKFTTAGDINDKILTSVIGNKLNSFTPLTYNDTRDFIYQIIDSGEIEFIKDFIEKVFSKATLEELYCALFAKLIAEIAHRYPIIYEEMNRYHEEFLKIFEDVQEDNSNYDRVTRERQYRLGYGQFISELASLNALEKGQLLAMVGKVNDKIWILTEKDDKVKTVEEFIDCLVRLTRSLRDKSPKFFLSVKDDMKARINERVSALIDRTAGERPSLSTKARFGLMDLKDIL